MFTKFKRFWYFYQHAITKYQVHSPVAFEVVMTVFGDRRNYYAFDEIKYLRRKIKQHNSALTRQKDANISARWGHRLFRLTMHFLPSRIVCVNPGHNMAIFYAAKAVSSSTMQYWSQDFRSESIFQAHAELLGLQIKKGRGDGSPFILMHHDPDGIDLEMAFHAYMATAPEKSLLILMEPHSTLKSSNFWNVLKNDPGIQMSIDFWGMGVVIKDAGILEKQHFNIVPAWMKIWRFL
jgi:hypothetical protein